MAYSRTVLIDQSEFNYSAVHEWLTGEGSGRGQFQNILSYSPRRAEETHGNLSDVFRSPCRDSNRERSE
jgi:hypothetical protein